MIILVVDDTDDIRLMLKMRLESKGHYVVEAADGHQAIELAISERPDVILMDLSMPVMDGIEAAKYLRQRSATSNMPIIAVTAHCGDPAWHSRALAAGCVGCVGKPVDFKKLDQLINSVRGS
jgi:CheY-like chemotaxis protein